MNEGLRLSITLGVILTNFGLLIYLVKELREAKHSLLKQNRIIATVSPMIGLMRALQEGLGAGGLSDEQRRAIYEAFDEQTAVFYAALGLTSPERPQKHDALSARLAARARAAGQKAVESI